MFHSIPFNLFRLIVLFLWHTKWNKTKKNREFTSTLADPRAPLSLNFSQFFFLLLIHSFVLVFVLAFACLLIVLSLFSSSFMEMQNLLFYYENENSSKPSGIIFLEGSYCERLTTPPSCVGSPVVKSSQKEDKLQVSYCYYNATNQIDYSLRN